MKLFVLKFPDLPHKWSEEITKESYNEEVKLYLDFPQWFDIATYDEIKDTAYAALVKPKSPSYMFDEQEVIQLFEAGIKFLVANTRKFGDSMPAGPSEVNYNSKVDVHMPGQALANYNELMLLEDCCTDELARSLDNGWRIIAACPQPDQRRPDWILGRYNPNRVATNNTGALRYD